MAGAALALIGGAVAITNFTTGPESGIVDLESAVDVPDAEASPSDRDVAGDVGADAEPLETPTAAGPLNLPDRPVVGAHERVSKPRAVRGLYLNAWAAGSSRKLDRLIEIANRTEINAFVIDVKEVGEISYPSAVPLAAEIGADRRYIPNIQRVISKLKENGIYPIARIVVFRDAVLAQAKPEWAIQKADGSVWQDHHGAYWVDSFNKDVWDYNIAIAREAIELGFSEIQWDYVRTPDVPQSYMRTAVWPAREGRAKEDAIREFLRYSREQLADLAAPVTADVFGLTVSANDDMGIGQVWEKMVDATDVLLPMVYPSHFARGSYGIANPNSEPYDIVRKSLGHAVRRTEGVQGAAGIRPWLQDFTLGPPRYGPSHVRAQISAVYDAGLEEWVLWNPGSNYTLDALAGRDGVAPSLDRPATAQSRESSTREPASRPATTTTDSTAKAAPNVWGVPVRPDTTRKVKRDTTTSRQ